MGLSLQASHTFIIQVDRLIYERKFIGFSYIFHNKSTDSFMGLSLQASHTFFTQVDRLIRGHGYTGLCLIQIQNYHCIRESNQKVTSFCQNDKQGQEILMIEVDHKHPLQFKI